MCFCLFLYIYYMQYNLWIILPLRPIVLWLFYSSIEFPISFFIFVFCSLLVCMMSRISYVSQSCLVFITNLCNVYSLCICGPPIGLFSVLALNCLIFFIIPSLWVWSYSFHLHFSSLIMSFQRPELRYEFYKGRSINCEIKEIEEVVLIAKN